HPVEFAVAAVDAPRQRLKLVSDVGIGDHRLARRGRDLRQGDLAAVVSILFEEAAEGTELLRQALGVVETVDAQQADGRRRWLGAALGARADEGIDVDADGEAGDRQLAVEGADAAVLKYAPEHAVLQV